MIPIRHCLKNNFNTIITFPFRLKLSSVFITQRLFAFRLNLLISQLGAMILRVEVLNDTSDKGASAWICVGVECTVLPTYRVIPDVNGITPGMNFGPVYLKCIELDMSHDKHGKN